MKENERTGRTRKKTKENNQQIKKQETQTKKTKEHETT